MNNLQIAEKYLGGLIQRLSEDDRSELTFASGATENQIDKLKERFPQCPDSLLQLLKHINGTYWQQYGDHEISVLVLGSDMFEYPYYLKSVEQILEVNHFTTSIREMYGEYLSESSEIPGKGINPDVNLNHWLCFSDCMNNGGTSPNHRSHNLLSNTLAARGRLSLIRYN